MPQEQKEHLLSTNWLLDHQLIRNDGLTVDLDHQEQFDVRRPTAAVVLHHALVGQMHPSVFGD